MVKSPNSFLRIINTSESEYEQIKSQIDHYYTKKTQKKTDQFGRVRFDSDGNPKVRTIHPSFGKLKNIQRLINERILVELDYPDALHGSIRNKSCITNARAHQGKKYSFLTDLKSYFPSIHYNIVHNRLKSLGFSIPVASMITRLVTFKECVPQGAPTSSRIANLVFVPYDKQLLDICESRNLTYTRYVDDLAFSRKGYITQEVIDEILEVIKNSPFRFHPRKTHTCTGIKEITGVLVGNNGLDAPLRKYKKLDSLEPESNSAQGLQAHINQIKRA